MRAQSIAEKNSSAGLIPQVHPRMHWRVARLEVLPGFRLHVGFVDGLEGIVDMADLVKSPHGGVFNALAEVGLFNKAYLEHGAVTWEGEIDLAPDAMHAAIKKSGVWKLG